MMTQLFAPLRRLYAWTLGLASHRHAEKYLAGVSFAESSFFPIPPDVMLLPMVFAQPQKAFRYALICTLASVAGGIAGYMIGAFLWELVGVPLLTFYGVAPELTEVRALYMEYGTWVILIAGFTPIPYKIFTIASGLFLYPLLPFILLSCVARGGRFFLLAALLYWGGRPIRRLVEQHFELLTAAFGILLVLGFVVAFSVL